MAHLLGGFIEVRSTPGEGSVFTLFLPMRTPEMAAHLAAPTASTAAPTVADVLTDHVESAEESAAPVPLPAGDTAPAGTADVPTELPTGPGPTVLVVDDDARNIFALTEILRREGMRVLRAEDGRSGLALLAEHADVDLVLMDVMMAGMDGYATTAAIRALPGYTNVPIVAVTAQAMPGDREKALAAGADDYVTKPVDADELAARIHTWLT